MSRKDWGNAKARDLKNCRPVQDGADCCKCYTHRTSDIYDCNGWILCGDCRYELRHGYPPHLRKEGTPSNRPATEDELTQYGGGSGATHTLNRVRHQECRSSREFDLLCEIEGCHDSKQERSRQLNDEQS